MAFHRITSADPAIPARSGTPSPRTSPTPLRPHERAPQEGCHPFTTAVHLWVRRAASPFLPFLCPQPPPCQFERPSAVALASAEGNRKPQQEASTRCNERSPTALVWRELGGACRKWRGQPLAAGYPGLPVRVPPGTSRPHRQPTSGRWCRYSGILAHFFGCTARRSFDAAASTWCCFLTMARSRTCAPFPFTDNCFINRWKRMSYA